MAPQRDTYRVLFQCGLIQNGSLWSRTHRNVVVVSRSQESFEDLTAGGVFRQDSCRVKGRDAWQLCKARLSPCISLKKKNPQKYRQNQLSVHNLKDLHRCHSFFKLHLCMICSRFVISQTGLGVSAGLCGVRGRYIQLVTKRLVVCAHPGVLLYLISFSSWRLTILYDV